MIVHPAIVVADMLTKPYTHLIQNETPAAAATGPSANNRRSTGMSADGVEPSDEARDGGWPCQGVGIVGFGAQSPVMRKSSMS